MEKGFLGMLKEKLKERGFRVEMGYVFLPKEGKQKGGEQEERKIYLIYPFTDWKKRKAFIFFEKNFDEETEENLYENLKRVFL